MRPVLMISTTGRRDGASNEGISVIFKSRIKNVFGFLMLAILLASTISLAADNKTATAYGHSDQSESPNRNSYLKLTNNVKPLTIVSHYPGYALGESIGLKIVMPIDGYLNIVSVDSTDHPTVLFPNANHPNNFLKAGTYQLPDIKTYDWPVAAPFGPTLLVALVSRREMNLFGSNYQRDLSGKRIDPFAHPTAGATRGLGEAVSKAASRFYGASLTINTCATVEECE